MLNALPCDFIETNKKIYLQLEMEEQKIGTQTVVDTESDECDKTVKRIPPHESIVDVLIKKRILFF